MIASKIVGCEKNNGLLKRILKDLPPSIDTHGRFLGPPFPNEFCLWPRKGYPWQKHPPRLPFRKAAASRPSFRLNGSPDLLLPAATACVPSGNSAVASGSPASRRPATRVLSRRSSSSGCEI